MTIFSPNYNVVSKHFYNRTMKVEPLTASLVRNAKKWINESGSDFFHIESAFTLATASRSFCFVFKQHIKHVFSCDVLVIRVSLCSSPTVHMCSIDGDSENHTALDLKLVFPLIVTYNITEQVIYHSLPAGPPLPSLPPGWMMLSELVTPTSILSLCVRSFC